MVPQVKIKNGEKYGYLEILKETNIINGVRYFDLLCICGKIINSRLSNIRRGQKSCGCIREGNLLKMSQTRFYRIYNGIKARVYNIKEPAYYRYGGRGIQCEWEKFEEFKKDMYESYLEHCKKYGEKQTTIDRINNDGNYSKDNCRWATMKEQNSNKNYNVKYQGELVIDICRKKGISIDLVKNRINNLGWTIEDAINAVNMLTTKLHGEYAKIQEVRRVIG